MRISPRSFATAILGAAWLLSIPAVNAQAQRPAPGSTAPSSAIPDHKLDATAAAITQVAMLSRGYQEKIAVAPEADKQRLVAEAGKAMEKAVTDQGLSVQEYNSIVEEAQSNPEIHEKIVQRLKKPAQ
jgi:hypothetical protein